MAMAVMTPTASAFSDDVWMRAVLAHVPATKVARLAETAGPFRLPACRHARFPLPYLEVTTSALTPCSLPVVTGEPSLADARHFLNRLAAPLLLRSVPRDHPLTLLLLKAAGHANILAAWQRAALDVSGSFDDWMAGNFDHKRRKELKRLKSRLAEQGDLTMAELRRNDDLSPHLKDFLDLESSGWKGQRGTAIKNNPAMQKGLAAGLAAMHAEGRVRFWTLRLDGKPVASLFALVDRGEAVLGKIGFDESFSRYSPGVLLIIEATRSLFEDPEIRLADANAMPGHPMIDRIWRDRIACMDVVLAGPALGRTGFAVVTAALSLKSVLRNQTKKLFLRITGRKLS